MEYSATPTLTGRFVTLEALTPEHADGLAKAVRDGDVWERWYNSHVPRPENTGADIQRLLASREAGTMAPWVVRRRDTGAVCGISTYCTIDQPNRRVEIGSTWLAASAQGTAINPELKLLLLTRAFETLGCLGVEFRTHWHNRQSRAAIEKLGAKQDGVLRSHRVMPDGSLRDTVVYSIIDIEWPAVRNGLDARLAAFA